MNKIIIAAVATSALATYLIARRRSRKHLEQPVVNHIGGSEKHHLTNVFAKAKKQGM